MKQSKRKREAAADIAAVPAPTPVKSVAVPVQAPHSHAANAESGTAKRSVANAVYKLAPSCTVRDCAPLKMALSDFINVESETILDVSAIEANRHRRIATLYAFVRERKTHNRKVMWQGSSECFFEAVQILGMETHLDVPQVSDLTAGATSDARTHC